MLRAFAFAALLGAAASVSQAQQGAGDVVFVPTPQIVVDAMLRMANVGPDDYLIDLGSGDGRVVVGAARRGARALGVDLDHVLLERAIAAAKREGVAEHAAFLEQNLFETELRGATVVTTYLLPEINLKLRPKLLELAPGTRVVAHDYHMGNWLPDERETLSVPEKKVGNPGVSYIYLWHVPARVAGRWKAEIPGGAGPRELEFDLEQRFQIVNARAHPAGGRPVRMHAVTLRGDKLSFEVEIGPGRPPLHYAFRGVASGDQLRGTARMQDGSAGHEYPFTAKRVMRGVAIMN